MKRNTMETLANYLNSLSNLPEDVVVARDELNAENAKNANKAQANREAYAAAHDAVMNVLSDKPMTVQEIFDACADELPEGFSKSKVQYGILNYWNAEIVKIENPKSANQYRRA